MVQLAFRGDLVHKFLYRITHYSSTIAVHAIYEVNKDMIYSDGGSGNH